MTKTDHKKAELGRRNFQDFVELVFRDYQFTPFHKAYSTVIDLFAKGEINKLIVSVAPQHGKALKKDTPVLTTKGWREHKDLEPGDFVYGEFGQPVEVIHNHGVHNIPCSKVSFSSSESIIASDNHEWAVWCDREKYRKKGQKAVRVRELLETSKLMEGQRRNPAIPSDICLSMNGFQVPLDPYRLGCWLGDGNSRNSGITTGNEDLEHFTQYFKYMREDNTAHRLKWEGVTATTLKDNDLYRNKHIPEAYFHTVRSMRVALLQGLMDTDGCVDNRGRCEFTQKKGRLASEVYLLLRTLGLKPSINTYDMKLNGRSVGLKERVCFTPPKGFQVFRLERKQERLEAKINHRQDSAKWFIESVDSIGSEDANCITVEGGLYLAGRSLILTHNSVISSQLLPSYILGTRPDTKVVIASYAQSLARKFGRLIKQIMHTQEYSAIFRKRMLGRKEAGKINTADTMDVSGGSGSLTLVGRGSGLTGNRVDTLIIDDLYKDAMEANSPVVRAAAIEWYQTVAETRLHNNSQQLIVFTRWHQEDLIGWLEDKGLVIELTHIEQLKNIDNTRWYKINFEALKTGEPTDFDKRIEGEALFPQMHDRQRLEAKRTQDKEVFESLYQGNPKPSEGLLFKGFETYKELPSIVNKRVMYVDVADTGKDRLCAIAAIISDNKAYVTDVLYTDEPGEVTEPLIYGMIKEGYIDAVWIESNAGGRAFARNVEVLCREARLNVSIRPFHQSQNKEARIITGSSAIQRHVIFPYLWDKNWPIFYKELMNFKKLFRANSHDDAPDALTGLVEKEIRVGTFIGMHFK